MSEQLVVRNVVLGYGRKRVLVISDFRVEPGTMARVRGPNGGGKTTCLDVVSGFLRPMKDDLPPRGDVVPNGSKPIVSYRSINLLAFRPYQIARLGIGRSFQRQPPPGGLTVEECLAMVRPSEANGVMLQFAAESGVMSFAKSFVYSLSGGFQRKLGLACALGQGSSLLLLDEPFFGMDIPAQQLIAHVLARRVESGVAIVLAEHRSFTQHGPCIDWSCEYGQLVAES